MKKFTKGCLMTALVLFLVGLVLCGVCGLLGGFRQLSEMDGIGRIPFRYGRNAAGDWKFGFFRAEESEGDDTMNPEEIEDIRKSAGDIEQKLAKIEGKKEQLSLTAETLGSLEIDVVDCNVIILESSDEYVWFLADGNISRPHYTIENGSGRSALSIENEVEHHFGYWRKGPNDTIYLWLPKGCALEEYDVDLGAGYMKSIFITARQTAVNLGAGLLEAEGFEGETGSFLVGAGEILMDRITAETAAFEIGAGHLDVGELSVNGSVDLDVNMGEAEIAGTISGDLDLECGMGEAVLRLTGSEEDHSYNVECGMGSVSVGNYSHDGFAAEKSWNTGKNSEFDINCGMGNVTVTFEE